MTTSPDHAVAVRLPALRRWVADHVGLEADWTVERLPGGNSNATFRLAAHGTSSIVLRRPPLEALDASAHDVGREHRVLGALYAAGVPVPEPLAVCTDSDIIGAPFLLMEAIPGVSITDALPAAYDWGPGVTAVGEAMIDALAVIHDVNWRAAGLEGFGRPEGFLGRQVSRWRRQYERNAVRELPLFDEVARWLEANRPPSGEPAVMHGDFHLDNCLFDPAEPRLRAVIDWEMATIGDPLLDVGLMLALWGRDPDARVALPAIQGVSRRADAPTRQTLVSRYADRTERPIDVLPYYMTLALWKLAAIIEGAYALHLAGRLSTDYGAGLGRDVPYLLEEAASHSGMLNR